MGPAPAAEYSEEVRRLLGEPPSRCGVKAGFWGVPALRDAARIQLDAEYDSDSSYQLLMRSAGTSLNLLDPFDKRRDEAATAERMTHVRQEVAKQTTPALSRLVRQTDNDKIAVVLDNAGLHAVAPPGDAPSRPLPLHSPPQSVRLMDPCVVRARRAPEGVAEPGPGRERACATTT